MNFTTALHRSRNDCGGNARSRSESSMSIFGQLALDRSVALPALQFKVALEEVKVEPGAGLTICTGPVVGGAR